MTPFTVDQVECNKGWEGLYQPLLDLCQLYGYKVLQVKEKFGGLRFYYATTGPDAIDRIVAAAEAASYHTCEDCGTYGILKHTDEGKPVYVVTTTGPGWIRSLCPACREMWLEKRTNR